MPGVVRRRLRYKVRAASVRKHDVRTSKVHFEIRTSGPRVVPRDQIRRLLPERRRLTTRTPRPRQRRWPHSQFCSEHLLPLGCSSACGRLPWRQRLLQNSAVLPGSTYKLQSGDLSMIWQLAAVTRVVSSESAARVDPSFARFPWSPIPRATSPTSKQRIPTPSWAAAFAPSDSG